MHFKSCKYYKQAEQVEHCPFSPVCSEACIFTYTDSKYRVNLGDITELQEENELLKSRLKDGEQELNDYTMSLDNREETIKTMCDIIAKLLISARIKKVDKYIGELEESYQDEIKDKMGFIETKCIS